THNAGRPLVLTLLLLSYVLLIPGVLTPVLTIRGVLTPDGVAAVAPTMLDKGISNDVVGVLKGMMNPSTVMILDAMRGGDMRKAILAALTPQVTAALQKGVSEVEVYTQTRSIISSVRRLYEVGSPVPATLILLFSIVVPVTKGLLVGVAMFMKDLMRR